MAVLVAVPITLVLLITCPARAEETASTEEFDVKPGSLQYTYSRTLGVYSCSFTYTAQGGTNEKWQMSIGINDDNKYFSCSIWRPTGSYLFFQNFKAEIMGGKIEFCEVYSQVDKPLKKSEYDVTDNSVLDRPGSFSSSLFKISLVAKSAHEEL